MSRPSTWIGVGGFRPSIASVVDFWKNSGTISTRPPTATTSRISTIIRKLLVSIFWCEKPDPGVLELIVLSSCVGCCRVRGNAGANRLTCGERHRDIPRHHQHAAQVEKTSQQAYYVVGKGGLDALDEGVGERAVGIDRAPHQAL